MKYQVGFKHLFCFRLLRSAFVTFLKTGCKYQNVITSGIYRTYYSYEIINPDTCQRQITLLTHFDTRHPVVVLTASTCSLEYSLASIFFLTLFDTRVYSSSIYLY